MSFSSDQPAVSLPDESNPAEEIALKNALVETQGGQPEWPADLFPLPISPFERLMWDDDHFRHPRVFTVVLEFNGVIDRAAYESAIRNVVRRNPLLSSVLRKVRGQWSWIYQRFPSDQIVWEDFHAPSNLSKFDIKRVPGFAACAKTDGTRSELHLIFHHAVADGHGARRVVIDWLTSYAAIVTPETQIAPLDELDYERLRNRSVFKTTPVQEIVKPVPGESPSLKQRVQMIVDFLRQQPVPLRSRSKVRRSKKPEPHHLQSDQLCREQVKQFRDRLRGSDINLNDVAVALLLNCIARWNRSHGEVGRDRLYRVLVPADLREASDKVMPAANKMSFLFIARPTSLCLDWKNLLPTIRAEMDYIDQHGSRFNLVNALPVAQSIPGLVKIGTRLPACFSTATLTNLGDTVGRLRWRFPADQGFPLIGNLHYVRSSGVPPLRPKTSVGIGLTISHGEMVIRSQVDSTRFNQADSAAFQKMYVESWMNWCQGQADFA